MVRNMKTIVNIIFVMCFVFLALVIVGAKTYAQDQILFNPKAEEIFYEALKNFENENYLAAATMFLQVEEQFPLNQRTTAAIVMRAKIFLRSGNYDSSLAVLNQFLKKYPKSSYASDAHYTIGENFYFQQRYQSILNEMVFVIESSRDTTLVRRAEELLSHVSLRFISLDSIREFNSRMRTQPAIVVAGFILAQKLAQANHFEDAVKEIKMLRNEYPDDRHVKFLDNLEKHYNEGTPVKIGVLVPLTNRGAETELAAIGNDALAGMKLAVEAFNQSSAYRVSIDVRDTKRDSVELLKQIGLLASDKEVVAMVGPLFSDEVRWGGLEASSLKIPMITPTATAVGLTEGKDYVFQANPDYKVRGSTMAKFAVGKLGLKHLAVLASSESFCAILENAFVEEAQRLGAKIEVLESYDRGSTDLQKQIQNIRKKSLELLIVPTITFNPAFPKKDIPKFIKAGIANQVIDSLIDRSITISAKELFGEKWKAIVDSFKIPIYIADADTINPAVPAKGIEAIYVPIGSPVEIGIVAAQLSYYNIQTQLLGSGDWNNIDELDANGKFVNGMFFETDSFIPQTDQRFLLFSKSFSSIQKKSPDKNAIYGYDTMMMLLQTINRVGNDRTVIADALNTLNDYQSLHSIISFSPDRINTKLHILQYNDGQIVKVSNAIDTKHNVQK